MPRSDVGPSSAASAGPVTLRFVSVDPDSAPRRPSARTVPRVVLVGPPGAGKSTVADILARRLGVRARDTDTDVEAGAGKSVADIFVEDGEPRFRLLEREAVLTALAEHDGVLALGGGAVLDEAVAERLGDYRAAGGHVVFLDVTLPAAAPRVGFNTSRPLLVGNPRARWQALMAERRPVYQRVSSASVLTDDLTPREVADHIMELLGTQEDGDD